NFHYLPQNIAFDDFKSGRFATSGMSMILIDSVNHRILDVMKDGADVKIMDSLFWHREVPHSENFSKPGFQLKTA
ncbi:hypothetical protein, partial [Weissella confusa]|uniref:hypothetical protein n=1 Tax=Weissella confusa TaxID=1583 RepID=UPI001AEC349A